MAGIGYVTLSVLRGLKGFSSKLSKGIDPHMSAAGAAGGKRFGGGMLAGAKKFVGPIAALFAAKVGVDFFKGAIDGASNLTEASGKVGIVFGAQAAQILKASKTSATAMGMSKTAYLDANGTLGNLLGTLKLTPQATADMSQKMVQLAADMGAFNNVPTEEALAAIQSGLTGEAEPLKKFGVLINDATLKTRAMSMGLISSTNDALTPQNKALASQAEIMAQTTIQQGNFADTSKDLAGQQKILASQTDDLKTKLGGFLLPVVTKVTTAFTGFMGGIQDSTGAGGRFKEMILGVWDKMQPLIGTLVGFYTTVIKGFVSGLGDGTGAGGAFRDIVSGIASFFMDKLIPAVTKVYQMVLPALMGLFKSVTSTMNDHKDVINFVKAAFGILGDFVTGVLLPVLGNLTKFILNTLGPVFRGVITVIEDVVIPGIKLLVGAVLGIIGKILEGAASAFGWIPDIGDKLETASAEFNKFRDRTNAALNGIHDKTINVSMKLTGGHALAKGIGGAGGQTFAGGTNFAPGGPALVGERGPEIVNLPRGSQVIPNHQIGGSGFRDLIIYEAVSPMATAMQVSRRQAALGAV